MSLVVFLGPSLNRTEAEALLPAEYLPPVAQGDVYRAARRRPRAIGIIDGYFDRVPSVWHKEILWALSQGIYVFGAASMGALRAAELVSFGMVGVGHVFKAFHDGVLEDDDEVAVVHGSEEDGYRPLSDAMVDIRATIRAAVAADAVDAETATALVHLAKVLPYPERSFRRLERDARRLGFQAAERFWEWLPKNRVQQKRADAVMMLRAMNVMIGGAAGPHIAKFRFEHTEAWEAAKTHVRPEPSDERSVGDARLMDELRLDGSWERSRNSALARALILHGPGARLIPQLDPSRAEHEFRALHGLHSVESFVAWCEKQGATPEQLRPFFVEEAAVRIITLAWRNEVLQELPNYLRSSGEFASLQTRIAEKAAATLLAPAQRAYLQDLGLEESTLFDWYFTERKGIPVPARIDQHAVNAGFEDLAEFRRAVVDEYLVRTTRAS